MVADNGIGIPEHLRGRIFDIFSQVDSSLERSQGGLGIGLSLAKSLVEMHGGRIWVQDAPERGSQFVVELPTREAPQQNATAQAPKALPANDVALKVLVVDDNEASAKTLGWTLEIFGCETQLAHSGPAAIEAARVFLPDIILLDIGLPGMNGYEVCKALKSDAALAHTIFIAQTGWGQEEHRQKSRSVGFDYHLVKPVEIGVLQEIVDTIRAGGQ